MKLPYYPETDSLYIELSEKASEESRAVALGVVLDFDASGFLVGLDVDQAGQVLNLERVESQALPVERLTIAK